MSDGLAATGYGVLADAHVLARHDRSGNGRRGQRRTGVAVRPGRDRPRRSAAPLPSSDSGAAAPRPRADRHEPAAHHTRPDTALHHRSSPCPRPARAAKVQNGQISFWSDRASDRAQVYVMNADGGRQHAITRQFSAKRGAFSPDGRRIAFDGRAYNTLFDFDIFVAAASGRGAKRITRGPDRDLMPAWSPDGRTIAFSRQAAEEDMPDIWLVGADGSDPPSARRRRACPELGSRRITHCVRRARRRGDGQAGRQRASSARLRR